MRICSLLPSATEIVYALGLGDSLAGVTHECDYPKEVQGKPVVVRNALDLDHKSQGDIDRLVSERIRSGASLYHVDEELVRRLAPEHAVCSCDYL